MGRAEGEIKLRAIGVDDWRLWRRLRLAALEEAPYAFSSRLADWQGSGDTESRWRQRLADVPLNLVAEWRRDPAGMASGTAVNPDGSVDLISMWVAPFARGRGIGDLLVQTVIEWARKAGGATVSLTVTEGNERALALYRRHGFMDVSGAEAAPERKMALSLWPAGRGDAISSGGPLRSRGSPSGRPGA